MSVPHSSRLRRLNGRLQACDPCRKRKVACDHGQPSCGRCKRKGLEGLCTYTISARSVAPIDVDIDMSMNPAPSTRTYHKPSPSPAARSAKSSTTKSTESRSGAQSPSTSSVLSPNSSSRAPGYLGFASYTTVFQEARQSLQGSAPDEDTSMLGDGDHASIDLAISQATLDACVAVLQQLPTADDTHMLEAELFVFNSWVYRIASRIQETLYDPGGLGSLLGRHRDRESLKQLARVICINTAKPIVDDVAHGDDWIAQFTGRNMRWESIGEYPVAQQGFIPLRLASVQSVKTR
jgi:hypothetical protein